jgi:hypothetical protein
MGKLSELIWPFTSVQKQFTWSPLMPLTVINGPPERSRTRLPLPNAGAAWFCVVDGAEAEEAGAIPSVFVDTPRRPTVVKPGLDTVSGDGPSIGVFWTAPGAGART